MELGTNLTTLTFDNDYFLGSILAPKTHIFATQNLDGNIIGDRVSVSGETHRWDWMMPANPVIPNPTPKLKPEPEPQPKPEPGQPNFFPPAPKVSTSDEPETPQFSEPQAQTPLPDTGTVTPDTSEIDDEETFFQSQAKHHIGKAVITDKKVKTVKKVNTATAESKVEQPVIKRVSTKKVATVTPQVKKTAVATLPQAGQKQNHSTLLGLIISTVAMVIGFFFCKQKSPRFRGLYLRIQYSFLAYFYYCIFEFRFHLFCHENEFLLK